MLAMARSSLVRIKGHAWSSVGLISDKQTEKRHPAVGAICLEKGPTRGRLMGDRP